MNEQLLKMNGLSVEILNALSFESHLGIPLKKNLHYFDKELLIEELVAMTEWLDEQEILSGIVKDNNGIPNKLYKEPVEVESTLNYDGSDYTWSRVKKGATVSSRTSINPRDILKVSRELINSTEHKILPLISYQSASRHWVSARSDANEKKRAS